MLAIEASRRALAQFERMPVGAQVGLLVMALAFAADLLLHLGGPGLTPGGRLQDEPLALGVGFAGMLIVLVAVVGDGAGRGRRSGPALRVRPGGSSDAHR